MSASRADNKFETARLEVISMGHNIQWDGEEQLKWYAWSKTFEEEKLLDYIDNLQSFTDLNLDAASCNFFLANLAKIEEVLNNFFNNVLVISADSNLTSNRLKILMKVIDLFDSYADFKELIK